MNQANQNLLHPSRQVGADLAAWRKVGGGEGLLAALADPQSIVSKLQDANLCGMGAQVSRPGANGRRPLPPKANMATNTSSVTPTKTNRVRSKTAYCWRKRRTKLSRAY